MLLVQKAQYLAELNPDVQRQGNGNAPTLAKEQLFKRLPFDVIKNQRGGAVLVCK